MIDFIMSWNVSNNSENIRNNPLLIFVKRVTKKDNVSGEPKIYDIYSYKDSIFSIGKDTIKYSCKIHKYFNNGKNYNDFTRCQLIEVLNELWLKFGINPHITQINTLEIGVNITYSPKKFIESILDYKGESVTITNNDFLYSESKKQTEKGNPKEYYMKAYYKDGQLRIEVHFIKTTAIRNKGIKTFADLTTPLNFKILGEILLDKFDNYLTFDNTMNVGNLKPREREILTNWKEYLFEGELRKTNPEKYKKRRARFKELIQANQQNIIQNEVRKLIVEKIAVLCKYEKTLPELTDCRKQQLVKTLPELTESDNINKQKFDSSKNTDFPLINHLDDRLKKGKFVKVKICPITGLNISMQKESSKFLSIAGISFYYEHEPELFKNELLSRIGKKWQNFGRTIQFREIAHSIRNECFNPKNDPRNNTKRAILKVTKYPSLFDNMKLIAENKRSIAGL